MEFRGHTIKKVEQMSKRMRKHVLDMALNAGASSSHFGGGLSIIEITATLYGAIMRLDRNNPEWSERDRFILSKGHGVLGYYTALAEAGFVPVEDLLTFEKPESYLIGHPVINRKRGIEFSNGSLGMGLSLAIGVALAGKRKDSKYKVYVLMGDGECNEGSVWEAAMAASQFKLNNLVGIIDKNNFQQTGPNKNIMSVGDLSAKWRSFGWDVVEVDGHNIGELYDAFCRVSTPEKPVAIIANTIKGKGFSFSENNNKWHHAVLTKSQYELAIDELNNC
jgi:transketolase|tara:strand:+ start:43 stop:876 length:834 start_codon:yes stop_codon:yes gene_type:complete